MTARSGPQGDPAFDAWNGVSAGLPPLPRRRAGIARPGRPLFWGIASVGALMGAPMSNRIVARLMKQACALAGGRPDRFTGRPLPRGRVTVARDLELALAA